MGAGGQEKRGKKKPKPKKTKSVTVAAAQQLEKNQGKRTAGTATWAQAQLSQEHREKQYSGTCSEMQDSSCREWPKNGGRRSKPTGLFTGEWDRGPRTTKWEAAWWSPSSADRVSTPLQCHWTPAAAGKAARRVIFFCVLFCFCSFLPEYQVSHPRDEGRWGVSARAEKEDAKGVKKQESRNGAEERSEK